MTLEKRLHCAGKDISYVLEFASALSPDDRTALAQAMESIRSVHDKLRAAREMISGPRRRLEGDPKF